MCINAYHLMKNEAVESVEVNLPFGEYANPSFESQVETVGKAKQSGIMSIERCVEELYGDSLDDDCKRKRSQGSRQSRVFRVFRSRKSGRMQENSG